MSLRSARVNISTGESMRRIKTIAEKIDELIASYETLNREAHDMIDLYIDERRLECPGIPIASMKQMEITNRAGSSLNVPQALQILKERKCAPR
jgi:hypothetical protein